MEEWINNLIKENKENLRRVRHQHNPSPGEDKVARTLRKLGIIIIREFFIDELEGDECAYRVADFYLPKYDLFIEYFGGWNKTIGQKEERERYKEKVRVYEENGIRFFSIKPDDLDFLDLYLKMQLKECKNDFMLLQGLPGRLFETQIAPKADLG